MNIFKKLEDNGFKVVGRYIQKRDSKTNNFEVKGYLNDNSIYFFSDNVHPFKNGVNYFSEYAENDSFLIKKYVASQKEKEAKNPFKTDFDTYKAITSSTSTFQTFLNNATRKELSKNYNNYYDLRGVSFGYMEDAVAFPFIDYNDNFVTAQLIKYNKNGKRLKSNYSTNWFHSYKPFKEQIKGVNRDKKYNVNVNCFFGENYLKGSDNIVAIVEAPKTAAILKEVYPNIDWIATAGEQQLFNKDLSVLENKEVVLFPDAHTNKWRKFGEEKGFFVSDILEKDFIEAGDDIADYLFNSESDVYLELHNLLYCLNKKEFDFKYKVDKIEFDFNIIKESKEYYTAVPLSYKGENVILSKENYNNSNVIFKGKYFNLYDEPYEVLNAQIDWHRPNNNNGVFEEINEKIFILRLQECFTILKYYNPNNYTGIFLETIDNLKGSNYSFNKKFIIYRLLPLWEKSNRNVNDFKKYRDWKFTSLKKLSRKEFVQKLNDTKFLLKLKISLTNVQKVITKKTFITTDNVGVSKDYKSRGFKEVMQEVKNYNEFYIGAKTHKRYKTNQKILDCIKNSPVHIKPLYSGEKNIQPHLSINEISKRTGLKDRNTIKTFLSFKSDYNAKDSLIIYVNKVLLAIKKGAVLIERFNSRIVGFKINEQLTDKEILQKYSASMEEAFKPINELKKELIKSKNNIYSNYVKDEILYLEFLELASKEEIDMNNYSERNTFIEKYYKEKLSSEPSNNKAVFLKVA